LIKITALPIAAILGDSATPEREGAFDLRSVSESVGSKLK